MACDAVYFDMFRDVACEVRERKPDLGLKEANREPSGGENFGVWRTEVPHHQVGARAELHIEQGVNNGWMTSRFRLCPIYLAAAARDGRVIGALTSTRRPRCE